jgi:hypothetical protein
MVWIGAGQNVFASSPFSGFADDDRGASGNSAAASCVAAVDWSDDTDSIAILTCGDGNDICLASAETSSSEVCVSLVIVFSGMEVAWSCAPLTTSFAWGEAAWPSANPLSSKVQARSPVLVPEDSRQRPGFPASAPGHRCRVFSSLGKDCPQLLSLTKTQPSRILC